MKVFVALLFLFFVSFSCKTTKVLRKTDCSYPLEGLWIGTFKYAPGTGTIQTPQYFSFIIKPDGSLIVESKDSGISYAATGYWKLAENILTCKYAYSSSVNNVALHQIATASYHNSGELSGGEWHNTDSDWNPTTDPNQTGTFVMHRIN